MIVSDWHLLPEDEKYDYDVLCSNIGENAEFYFTLPYKLKINAILIDALVTKDSKYIIIKEVRENILPSSILNIRFK